jgi:hypothetical protein
LSKRLNNFRANALGEAEESVDAKCNPGKLNLIQRIMKNVTTPVLIGHSREESKVPLAGEHLQQFMRALILRHIDKACQGFFSAIDEVKA